MVSKYIIYSNITIIVINGLAAETRSPRVVRILISSRETKTAIRIRYRRIISIRQSIVL